MKLTVGGRAKSNGFALPTILLVSTVMLIVLVASVAATAASRVSLDSQYYNQLAQQAAQSGIARAVECLKGSGYTPQWSTSATNKDLRPDSSCTGETLTGPNTKAFVVGNSGSNPSALRTRYTVEAGTGTGIGSVLRIVGITELVRTSSPNAVWRHYEQSLFYRIEPVQAIACPSGFIAVPGDSRFGTDDFCVGKYEAKNVGGKASSQAAGFPYGNITQDQAVIAAKNACDGCHLISEAEWLTIAHNVTNVNSNWSGGSVGNGYIYSGHNDGNPFNSLVASTDDNDGYFGTGNTSGNQRRTLTLSNGEVVWDMAGNVYELTSARFTGGQPGASGFNWREWNTIGISGNPPNPLPSYGTPAANSWTSANGMGLVYSDSATTNLHNPIRGGAWGYGVNAGIFGAQYNIWPTYGEPLIGFRIAYAPPRSDETVFVFDTTAPGCTGTVQLPVSQPATGGTVDWGNGVVQARTAPLQSYTYGTPGLYSVRYRGPISQASYLSVNATNAKCLTRAERWANNISPTRVNFWSASNLAYVAEPPATVTNMSAMFGGATTFNQPLASWNTTNVTNMTSMFNGATAFNQPLGSWNTTNVTSVMSMFNGARSFNQPINGWNTTKVTNMSMMFEGAYAFNQPLNGWNTAAVTDMFCMFDGAFAFNQPLNNWNTGNVTNMACMFTAAYAFNQPLNNWNTAKVTTMSSMFDSASAFNQNIAGWNVNLVTNWTNFHASSPLTQANCPPKLW